MRVSQSEERYLGTVVGREETFSSLSGVRGIIIYPAGQPGGPSSRFSIFTLPKHPPVPPERKSVVVEMVVKVEQISDTVYFVAVQPPLQLIRKDRAGLKKVLLDYLRTLELFGSVGWIYQRRGAESHFEILLLKPQSGLNEAIRNCVIQYLMKTQKAEGRVK